jgi:hypothetical protein
LVLKIKKEMIKDSIFIRQIQQAKADKPRESHP